MVTFGPELTLEQAIQQAVGAASMCWATPEGAGLFQEDRARAIADDLIAGLREGRWTETPPSGRPETIKDPAEHPDHPHGSTVEQVHRILGQAYADEPDRWMLAEELVKFVTKQVAREGITAGIIDAATRAVRPSTIPEHLDEAERLLALAYLDNDPEHAPGGYYDADEFHSTQVAAAEVHARIAHAAAAAGLLRPPREESDAPGLAALENLAAAVGRIAAAWERDQESTFSGRRGPTE